MFMFMKEEANLHTKKKGLLSSALITLYPGRINLRACSENGVYLLTFVSKL